MIAINPAIWTSLQRHFYPLMDEFIEYYKKTIGAELFGREPAIIWLLYWKLRELIPYSDPYEFDEALSNMDEATKRRILRETIEEYIRMYMGWWAGASTRKK